MAKLVVRGKSKGVTKKIDQKVISFLCADLRGQWQWHYWSAYSVRSRGRQSRWLGNEDGEVAAAANAEAVGKTIVAVSVAAAALTREAAAAAAAAGAAAVNAEAVGKAIVARAALTRDAAAAMVSAAAAAAAAKASAAQASAAAVAAAAAAVAEAMAAGTAGKAYEQLSGMTKYLSQVEKSSSYSVLLKAKTGAMFFFSSSNNSDPSLSLIYSCVLLYFAE
jgi:uncharacterized membrane protein YqiK